MTTIYNIDYNKGGDIIENSNGMIKKKLAYSIATYILDETGDEQPIPAVELYMQWKTTRNISLHYPGNAKYALELFEKLNHLSKTDRKALAKTVEIEADCLARNI